jgi:cell division protein FtsN
MASNQYNPRRQQQPAAAKKKKRSGASSNNSRPQVPGWMWLVAGVAVGVFVSFLVKLAGMPAGTTTTVALDGKAPKSATLETAGGASKGSASGKNAAGKNADAGVSIDDPGHKSSEKGVDKTADKATGDAARPVTKFDFYTLLPEREVIVPNEREAMKPAEKPKAVPGQAAPAEVAEEPLFLQVGSFRAAQEAERRRAQIILLGLEAKVESVQANGDTWYRVQSGPFTSREKLSKARNQLSAQGIESLLLKQKPQ